MRCIAGKGGGGGRQVLPFDALDERIRGARRRRHDDFLWQRADDGTSASKTLVKMGLKFELGAVGDRPCGGGDRPCGGGDRTLGTLGTGPGGGGGQALAAGSGRWGQALRAVGRKWLGEVKPVTSPSHLRVEFAKGRQEDLEEALQRGDAVELLRRTLKRCFSAGTRSSFSGGP
jgi:hypothetical protein